MFVLIADKNKLSIQQKEVLTSGSANICHVRFEFSEDWAGLTRTAVFKGSGETRSVLLTENNECVIPWETMKKPMGLLEAGVCGTRDTDIILTTVLANLGMILPGAAPGEAAQPPTPDVYQQILAETQDVREETAQNRQTAEHAADSAELSAKRAESAAVNPPRLSENNTWMIWDFSLEAYVDTGLSAIGPEGRRGETGPQGPQGIQGERGEQGPRGFPGTEVVIHETYGPAPAVTADMAVPGTPLQPVSEIRPAQEGEGTPSMENVRNITGWDKITLTHSGETHETAFPETVYGGSYNWAKGELTVTHKFFTLLPRDMNNSEDFPGWSHLTDLLECFPGNISGTVYQNAVMNIGTKFGYHTMASAEGVLYLPTSLYKLKQAEWKAQYPDFAIQIVLPLLEPRTIPLTPQEFLAFTGENTLSSNCGGTAVTFQAELKQYVDKKIQEAVRMARGN